MMGQGKRRRCKRVGRYRRRRKSVRKEQQGGQDETHTSRHAMEMPRGNAEMKKQDDTPEQAPAQQSTRGHGASYVMRTQFFNKRNASWKIAIRKKTSWKKNMETHAAKKNSTYPGF
jgi:hypothetical protein